MPSPHQIPCATCDGRRYIRTSLGWKPCACYWAQLSQVYIKRMVRQDNLILPDQWMQHEPWPLQDRREQGDGGKQYERFRYMVWRSLLAYFEQRLTYDYFDGFRLVGINFERDPEYKSVRLLKDLDLLVLVVGLHEPPNSYAPHLMGYVTDLRKMEGRPTWVYRMTTGSVGQAAQPAPPAVSDRASQRRSAFDRPLDAPLIERS